MTDELDPFDGPIAPDGMVYEWKALTIMGVPNSRHIERLEGSGWTVVPSETHHEVQTEDPGGSRIIISGMLLMQLPAELAEERRQKLVRLSNGMIGQHPHCRDITQAERKNVYGYVILHTGGGFRHSDWSEFLVRSKKQLMTALLEMTGLTRQALADIHESAWKIRKRYGNPAVLNYLDEDRKPATLQLWPKDPSNCQTARVFLFERDLKPGPDGFYPDGFYEG